MARLLFVFAEMILVTSVANAVGDQSITGETLRARSVPNGKSMFSQLSPEQTGVVAANAYDDPRMWGERYHELGVGAIGTGVAMGDFDNDGWPDLFVVSKIETCRLFRNLGGLEFEDVTERAGVADTSGDWKQGAAFADVNNDGWLDIYVCRLGVPNLLFINRGNGTFHEEAAARGLAVSDASAMAEFCDYDRDGWLDVYVHTNLLDSSLHPNGQRDYLFHNRGDGTFEDVTDRAGIAGETQGHSATWWDADEDGWMDLYVANDFATPDFLYHNNHDGTFSDVLGQVVPHTPVSSMGSDYGDVNNDGHIDFLVADMATTTHLKDMRGMADARGLHKDLGPGKPDKALQIVQSTLYLNTGTGRCLEGAYLAGIAATDWTWSPRFEDLDNDGRIDFHVTNGMNREQTDVDLIYSMMVAESPRERARLMRAAPVLREANLAFRNLGDLEFQNVSAAWGLDQVGVSFGSAFGDLDRDGDLDLVFTNYQDGPTVLRNDCLSGHRVIIKLRGTASNRFGVGATVRIETRARKQVRQLGLARGYCSTSQPILHFGLGDCEKVDRLVVTWPNGHVQEFHDLKSDCEYTIVEAADASASTAESESPRPRRQFQEVGKALGLDVVAREEKLEGTVPQPLLPARLNRRGPGIAIGDLDGDGTDEILLGATSIDPACVLRRQGAVYKKLSVPAWAEPPPIDAGPPLMLDVNGDGARDVLMTGGGAAVLAEEPEYEPSLYWNSGDGGFKRALSGVLPSVPTSAGAAVAADFNRDGMVDIFIGGRVAPGFYPEPALSALLVNREGRLFDVTDSVAPALRELGMISSALWSDVDGDGWMDLIVALDWGSVHYFHNEDGRQLRDLSDEAGFTAGGSGWWTSLASADFNGDGRPDYAVGNLGLNTQFKASTEHPILLFVADFAGTGRPQIVDALYEGDRLVPRRSRRELGLKIPAILKRFPKNDRYAEATLEDILGADALASATRYEATELRSGVFLSQAGGRYEFRPLPRIAQIAPIQGIVAGDFDGDGLADIGAVQNSYAPIPPFGRFDGGLGQLFAGDGAGGFRAVPAEESGIIVPGDAKALAVFDCDSDGWPDLMVSRNNTTTLAFRNGGLSSRHAFAVRVHGLGGNPDAVGTRVTVLMQQAPNQVAEVMAGGGYASQSSAACFFGYTDANLPQKISVRWPSGATTEHPFTQGTKVFEISQPAR